MEKTFNVVAVCGNKVFDYVTFFNPQVGKTFIYQGKEYKIIDVKHHISICDNENNVGYYTCNCELTTKENENRVMVQQVKILSDANTEHLQELVNNFLYENRHRYQILSINYNYYTCVIEYRLKTKKAINYSILNEMEMMIEENK